MVGRGKFFLYDYINPALDAGEYRLTADVDLDTNSAEDSGTPIAAHSLHFNISAPRIKLPPDQVLMTYPPANSEGAYESRLPQIVIKKRSLPWERAAGDTTQSIHGQKITNRTPWLALVVIAEGEGSLVHDVPAAECFTEGVTLEGKFDSPMGSYLHVPQSTVTKVFPTIDDLSLLSHVREVNPDDTENAMGDDDGFMAVIIGNRTPEYDEANCKPRSYMACLVNLEGQLGALPEPLPPQPTYDPSDFFTNAVMKDYHTAVLTGAVVPRTKGEQPRVRDLTDNVGLTDAVRRGDIVFHDGLLIDRVSSLRGGGLTVLGALDETSFLDGDFSHMETRANVRDSTSVAATAVEGVFGNFNFPLEVIIPEKFYKFPVLTSWRFTCSGAGSFGQLMSDLDVGLLGTKTDGGYQRQMPDCTPDASEDVEGSGAAPVTALPLEIAETGHVGMPHLTRTGNAANAWYRGPFSPFQLHRDPVEESSQFPKLAHVSDHLRMVTPDGREDVSLAVAFETGRLLAMSQPSFLVAVHRWRQTQFATRRRQRSLSDMLERESDLLGRLRDGFDRRRIEEAILAGEITRFMENGLLGVLGDQPDIRISTPRDPVEAGRKVAGLGGDITRLLANGLGIPHSLVSAIARDPMSNAAVNNLRAAEPGVVATDSIDLDNQIEGRIDDLLDQGLRDIANMTVGGQRLTEQAVRDITNFESLDDLERNLFGKEF